MLSTHIQITDFTDWLQSPRFAALSSQP